MIGTSRVLGIVPARGGSKGVPRKNLRIVAGKPLVGWTIEAAMAATSIDRVVVSSDDAEILGVAAGYGEGIALERPADLATDAATSLDVVLHVLAKITGFEIAVLLQPTSPLRTAADINDCLETMIHCGAASCISLCEAEENPYWMYRMGVDGKLLPLLHRERAYTRRQDLPPVYLPNGAIYAFRTDWIVARHTFANLDTVGYIMPKTRSLDIDTENDMRVLEAVMAALSNNSGAAS